MSDISGEFILTPKSKDEENKDTADKPKSTHSSDQHAAHFFSSYCEYPKGINFSEQERDEEIILLLRRHFLTNLPWILGAIFLSLIPPFFPLILRNFPLPLPESPTIIYYVIFYYIILFGFTLVNFSLWYFHTGLVTNKRLVDIDLAGILYRQISEAKIRSIEDVTYTQIGFIRSLFNYGDVFIQTAGAEANIEYDKVPRPARVADIIGDLTVK